MIIDLLAKGLVRSMLNQAVVAKKIATEELVELKLPFEKTDILQGIDVVWPQCCHLGAAGTDVDEAILEDS